MSGLKAYCAYEKGLREISAELVFHYDTSSAKQLALELCETLSGCDIGSVAVTRLAKADLLCKYQELPYVETRMDFLRAAGWHQEDGATCDICGLNDFNQDQWRVDPGTGRCKLCQGRSTKS